MSPEEQVIYDKAVENAKAIFGDHHNTESERQGDDDRDSQDHDGDPGPGPEVAGGQC